MGPLIKNIDQLTKMEIRAGNVMEIRKNRGTSRGVLVADLSPWYDRRYAQFRM